MWFVDTKLQSQIHDIWLLLKYQNYNISLPDIFARGRFSEIKKTNNTLPFV